MASFLVTESLETQIDQPANLKLREENLFFQHDGSFHILLCLLGIDLIRGYNN